MRHFRGWRLLALLVAPLAVAAGVIGLRAGNGPAAIGDQAFAALYQTPLAPPEEPLQVYHLGHSLVGHHMPAMLRQLAGAGHGFHSQMSWGGNLREHWEPDVEIKGFEAENQHPEYREPHEALAAGDYDAVVLTEAMPLSSAIRYQAPHDYLHRWSVAAWEGRADTRVYLYETWNSFNDEGDWLEKLDTELGLYWEGAILRRALAYDDVAGRPIHVIPGGQVFAAFVRAVEAEGGVGPIKDRMSLFFDDIHFNDYGAYLMALTHYAVLYGKSPVGLPHKMTRANGKPADDPGPEAARLMQETVWRVVTSYPPSGVAPD